jgi:hypothetical protein
VNNAPDPQLDDFALSFWYRPFDTIGVNQTIAGNLDSNAYALYYNYNGDTKNITLVNGTGDVVFEGNISIPTNRYTHILLNRESGTASLYLNGTLAGQNTFDQNVTYSSGGRFFVGSAKQVDTDENPSSYYWWRYYLDEVSYYNRSLNNVEIPLLYNDENDYTSFPSPTNEFTPAIQNPYTINQYSMYLDRSADDRLELHYSIAEANRFLFDMNRKLFIDGVLVLDETNLSTDFPSASGLIHESNVTPNVSVVLSTTFFNGVEFLTLNDTQIFPTGLGTVGSPYVVESCDQLQALGSVQKASPNYMELANDIECSTSSYEGNSTFYDFGFIDKPILGRGSQLNGNGHTISGAYKDMTGTTSQFQSLFGVTALYYGSIDTIKIYNITFENNTLITSNSPSSSFEHGGLLFGLLQSSAFLDMDDVTFRGNNVTGNAPYGRALITGQFQLNNDDTYLNNIVFEDNYLSGGYAGLAFGYIRDETDIVVNGLLVKNNRIEGSGYAGSLVGWWDWDCSVSGYCIELDNFEITDNYYQASRVGGLYGYLDANFFDYRLRDGVIINNTFNATSYSGAFIGQGQGNFPQIKASLFEDLIISNYHVNTGIHALMVSGTATLGGTTRRVFLDNSKGATNFNTGTDNTNHIEVVNMTSSEVTNHTTYAPYSIDWNTFRFYDGFVPDTWYWNPDRIGVLPYQPINAYPHQLVGLRSPVGLSITVLEPDLDAVLVTFKNNDTAATIDTDTVITKQTANGNWTGLLVDSRYNWTVELTDADGTTFDVNSYWFETNKLPMFTLCNITNGVNRSRSNETFTAEALADDPENDSVTYEYQFENKDFTVLQGYSSDNNYTGCLASGDCDYLSDLYVRCKATTIDGSVTALSNLHDVRRYESTVSNSENITVGGNLDEEDIVIEVNGDTENYTNYTTPKPVTVIGAGVPIVEFNYDFSQDDDLDFSEVEITVEEDVESASVVVDLGGQVTDKTLFLPVKDYALICVKDEEIASINEISLTCDGANEYDFTNCTTTSPLTIGNITCTESGASFEFSGLQNSGVLGLVEVDLEVYNAVRDDILFIITSFGVMVLLITVSLFWMLWMRIPLSLGTLAGVVLVCAVGTGLLMLVGATIIGLFAVA